MDEWEEKNHKVVFHSLYLMNEEQETRWWLENNMSRGDCSKIRQHLSIISTDGKEAKNKGRVEDGRERILPLRVRILKR